MMARPVQCIQCIYGRCPDCAVRAVSVTFRHTLHYGFYFNDAFARAYTIVSRGLGKGEVESSIPSRSTMKYPENPLFFGIHPGTNPGSNHAFFSAFRHIYFALRSAPSPKETPMRPLAAAVGLLLFLLLLPRIVLGHEFYSPWCCRSVDGETGDCQPIPQSAVQATAEGYLVTVTPADHARAKAPITRLFRYPDSDPSNDRGTPPEAQISPDGQHHACVLPSSQDMRCFYFAPGDS